MRNPSKLLQRCLKQSGMSKADLATKSGIRVQRINEWLRGTVSPRWETVVVLVAAMGFQVELRKRGPG